MKTLSWLVLIPFLLTAASAARAESVRISALAGTVEIQAAEGGAWRPATVGMEVPEGGTVRTSGDGRAELTYPNNGKVWLKESSQVVNESASGFFGRLSVAFGSLKAKFPHLARRQRMEFKTATAVAAIRGTEITISQTADGKFDLNVLFGKVDLRLTGSVRGMDVLQGHGYGVGRPGEQGMNRLLSKIEEVRGQEDWRPGLSAEERTAGLQAKEQNRDAMAAYVQADSAQRDRVRDVAGRAKEADLEAGRTLNDIHGNLVRVDQRLLRPSDHELQLINLVKRPNYVYNAPSSVNGQQISHWAYNGPAQVSNRLDALQTRLDFGAGHALPDEITAWPNFFKDNKPQHLEMAMSNQTVLPGHAYADDIFAIAMVGDRVTNPSSPQFDKVNSTFYVGQVKCGGAGQTAQNCLAGLRDYTNSGMTTAGDTAGTHAACTSGNTCFTAYENPTDVLRHSVDQSPANALVEISADRFAKVGATSDRTQDVWLAHELYVTNNGGSVRQVADFTSSNEDPFTIMKETAFENILYVKTSAMAAGVPMPASADVAQAANRNIDLVVTPDIILATIQKIVTNISNLNAN